MSDLTPTRSFDQWGAMIYLTRDEIRKACEALPGWEWDEEIGGVHILDHGRDVTPWRDFAGRTDLAIVMLEATGEALYIEFYPSDTANRWDVGIQSGCDECGRGHHSAGGPDLPTAVVRAVLAWAKEER